MSCANEIVVPNYYDDHEIDTIFLFDTPAFGANLINTPDHNIFPAAIAVGDIYYVGSEEVFFNVVWNIGTPGIYTGLTLAYEYWNGGWLAMTLGTNLSLYPTTDPWAESGLVTLNWEGAADWATTAINGETKFWIRIRVSAITTTTAAPENADNVVYNAHTPVLRIPSATLEGDAPPYVLLRQKAPAGCDDDEAFCNTSRVIMGAKSRNLFDFNSHLNCGGDGLPPGWVVTYGDDTSTAAYEGAPGGDRAECDFSGEVSMVMRVQFQGLGRASAYIGEYRPFLRIEGASLAEIDELAFKLRVYIDGVLDYSTQFETPAQGNQFAGDVTMEVIDLYPQDTLRIPFTGIVSADDLANMDIFFQIHAQQVSGSPTVALFDLILIPVDEWSVELDDPVTNVDTGSSALRGLSGIDDDGGVLDDRTLKFLIDGDDLSQVWNAETWSRHGLPPRFDPNIDVNIYYLHLAYESQAGWGEAPFFSRCGMMLVAEFYSHNVYQYIRGDD